MKISNNTSHNPLIEQAKTERAGDATATKQKGENATLGNRETGSGANIEISDNARLMQKAFESAKSAPEMRNDRVAQLKKSIKDGSYQVDSAKVADRLVDEHLSSHFGKNDL